MTDKTRCLRCDGTMSHIGVEKLQLGQTGLLLGMWNNIIAGALEVDIYLCPACRKVEFYAHSSAVDPDLPQKDCPQCGARHDFDYPKCPSCQHRY